MTHLLIVSALGVAAFAVRRRWPAIPAATLAYAILVAPNLGLVRHAALEQEVRLAPRRPAARFRLGQALERAKRFDEAAAQFAEGQRLAGEAPVGSSPRG